MFGWKKKRCTAETTGTVTRVRRHSGTRFVTVAYRVDGIDYARTEQMTYRKEEVYRLGPLPVGARYALMLGPVEPGDPVLVRYDPRAPRRSYLPGNRGRHIV